MYMNFGRAPARQSGGRRFKSRSSQFSLFIQIYLKSVPSQFPLWFITWYMNFHNYLITAELIQMKLSLVIFYTYFMIFVQYEKIKLLFYLNCFHWEFPLTWWTGHIIMSGNHFSDDTIGWQSIIFQVNQWVSDIASQYISIVSEELLGTSYEGG